MWSYFGEDLSKPLFLTAQMILIAAILCQLIVGASPLSQAFFKNRLLQYAGRISYSLYLWQQIFLVTKQPSWGFLRQFPLNLALCVLAAMLSFHLLETPLLNLKRKFQ